MTQSFMLQDIRVKKTQAAFLSMEFDVCAKITPRGYNFLCNTLICAISILQYPAKIIQVYFFYFFFYFLL